MDASTNASRIDASANASKTDASANASMWQSPAWTPARWMPVRMPVWQIPVWMPVGQIPAQTPAWMPAITPVQQMPAWMPARQMAAQMPAQTPTWKMAVWTAERWTAAGTATLLMPAWRTTAQMAAQQMAAWTATRTAAWRMPAQLLARCGGTMDASMNKSSDEHTTPAPAQYQPTNTMNILIYPSTKYNNKWANTCMNANESNDECAMPATMNGPTNMLTPSTNMTNTDILPFDHCHQHRCCSGAGSPAALMNHSNHNQVQIYAPGLLIIIFWAAGSSAMGGTADVVCSFWACNISLFFLCIFCIIVFIVGT